MGEKVAQSEGVHTQIKPICAALELAVKQCNQDCTPLSFAQVSEEDASEINLNQLEPSFMYTQLFKQTLLDMEHDRKTAVRDLVKYCQEIYAGNPAQLTLIDELNRDYQQQRAIWWYTREGFTYQMLNRALRLLEADIIVNMGFFIHDLHQQIQQLHQKQLAGYGGQPFVVYRGQGLSTSDFEKLKRSRGGLMSFNCFVSTSTKKDKPLEFARTAAMDGDRVGILFVMTIDPQISATPFADIREVSYYGDEAEVLFSMHTVFRIDTIQQMNKKASHVQVNLILTVDEDKQLNDLMEQLDGDVGSSSGWERMGRILLEVGQPDKAEELYHTLLEQTSDQGRQGHYYHQLGYIKNQQGDYQEAVSFYERALEIRRRVFLPIILRWLLPTTTLEGCMTTWASTRKHCPSTNEHSRSDRRVFLPIILRWLLPTTTLDWCMRTWASTRKHCPSTNEHSRSDRRVFLPIILRWLLPTTTLEGCMTAWASTRKHCPSTNEHSRSERRVFLPIILRWLLPTTTLDWCMTTWASTRKHCPSTNEHSRSDRRVFLPIILRWLLPTTTLEGCMTTWASTRKHCPSTNEHSRSKRRVFLPIILRWLLPTTTLDRCITTWASTRKHCPSTNEHSRSDRRVFLPIILRWLLPTTTLDRCIRTWASTRKHCPSTRRIWRSVRRVFLPIILIWLLPTTTLDGCIGTWASTRKHCPSTNEHSRSETEESSCQSSGFE